MQQGAHQLQADLDAISRHLAAARYPEMEDLARKVISYAPEQGVGWKALGVSLAAQSRYPEALALLEKAEAMLPADAEIPHAMGTVRFSLRRDAKAIAAFRKSVSLNPEFHSSWARLGIVLNVTGELAEAEACYRRALALGGNTFDVHNNLGSLLQWLGRIEEAEPHFRAVLEVTPGQPLALSNLIFYLAHKESAGLAEILAECEQYRRHVEAPLKASWPRHANKRDAERPLRIAFVSGDLRNHSVSYFMEPVLARLADSRGVEVVAYSNNVIEDDVSRQLMAHVERWSRVYDLSDDALAAQIQADGVDILIDLSGHTGLNRLPVFARKPAPVQVSWIGYPGTTGLTAMDYYLADRHFLPPGQFDQQFSEKIVHLPAVVPFRPAANAPVVGPLPALGNGFVTFGSFNRLSKISPSTVQGWSRLLREVPDSRLFIAGLPADNDAGLVARFAQHGVDKSRLRLQGRVDTAEFLQLHSLVDISLDTFVYTGGTTTLHSLWMGVPTLTVAGTTPAQRQGAAIMGHMGLEELIATDAEDFVRKGAALAGAPESLAALRSGMRERFSGSALGRPDVVAAGLEKALRLMWRR